MVLDCNLRRGQDIMRIFSDKNDVFDLNHLNGREMLLNTRLKLFRSVQ